mgnify:CR=1 FL=1
MPALQSVAAQGLIKAFLFILLWTFGSYKCYNLSMRTKGAKSYTGVPLWQLCRLFGGDMNVPVSRKWLEINGIELTDAPAPTIVPQGISAPSATVNKPETKEVEYEEF